MKIKFSIRRTRRTGIWTRRGVLVDGVSVLAYVKIAAVSLFYRASCSTSYQSPFLFAKARPDLCNVLDDRLLKLPSVMLARYLPAPLPALRIPDFLSSPS